MNNPNNNNNTFIYCSAIFTIMSMIIVRRRKLRRNKRRVWARNWLKRRTEGSKTVLNMLNEELKIEDPNAYKNFLRMTSVQLDYLLHLISPIINKQDTVMRDCIPSRTKLEITLRFLATGETFCSLMYYTRIHESTISRFIPVVCKALCKVLTTTYLKTPNSTEEWLGVVQDFNLLWQFPHCLGALDGRHIEFRPPVSAGSYYHNYKGGNSIVLLGLVDAKYKFLYVNIGVNGRVSDGGVYNQSELAKSLENQTLNIPSPDPLPGQTQKTPYFIVADEAFSLSENLMKPYPERQMSHDKRIFNYRLSRARRIVENAFGILANRFRVLLNPLNLNVEKTELITLTCVILHNYLAVNNGKSYTDTEEEDLQQLRRIGRQSGNRSSESARDIRNNVKSFVTSPLGIIPWQEKAVEHCNY